MNTKFFTLITLGLVFMASLSSCIKIEAVNPDEASGFQVEVQAPSLTPAVPILADDPSPTTIQKLTSTATSTPTIAPTATITATLANLLAAKAKATRTVTGTPVASDLANTCPGAPAIDINRKAWAQISMYPATSLNVRDEPGIQGKWIGRLKRGDIVQVLDGPDCADGYTWWLMRNPAGLEGWTAVGDDTGYWIDQPFVDTFYYDTASQSATSRVFLKEGQKYRIILSGTYSLWEPKQWTDRGVCIRGKSEPLPLFPSPFKKNNRVGADPYYHFARPFYGPCQRMTDPSETISKMMFSLDGGNRYAIPVPLIAKYREDHTYTYEVTGQGHPLYVRLDDIPLDDNYGQILVLVEKID